jgi:hypothetical protein
VKPGFESSAAAWVATDRQSPTMQGNTDDGRRIAIDNHDTDGRLVAGSVLAFETRDETVTVERETQDPRRSPERIECDRDSKSINQYSLVETAGRSRSGSASSLNHHDRLLFIARDDDEWTCYNPQPGATPRRDDGDYIPTQVPGVSVNKVFSRRGSRGSESGYKRRYKIGRELVESYDEVWMVEYRRERGGSRDGSYNRVKNATATELEVSN